MSFNNFVVVKYKNINFKISKFLRLQLLFQRGLLNPFENDTFKLFQTPFTAVVLMRYYIQQNDTQQNDTQQNDTLKMAL